MYFTIQNMYCKQLINRTNALFVRLTLWGMADIVDLKKNKAL